MSEQAPIRAIDRMVAHFQQTKGHRVFVDTAWGFQVWASPWTLGEQDLVFGANSEWRARSAATLLIVKGEDVSGNRLFKFADEHELLTEVDPKEVKRVAQEILKLLNADSAATHGGDAPKA